jgi:hypothetical protein
MGAVFWKNETTLDGDVVYAKNLAERNAELFEAYPDRQVYEAFYARGEVVEYGNREPSGGPTEVTAPRAGDIPTATPEPTATPDPTISARNDARRLSDLERVRDGLEQYHASRGRYPLAEGVQTLCGYSFDAACELKEFIDIPRDPAQGATYWYQSDGETFWLYASLEVAGDTSQCPQPLPQHLATVPNVYCVRGGEAPSTQE